MKKSACQLADMDGWRNEDNLDTFYMPTKIMFDHDCLIASKERIRPFGKTCLLVTGRSSARKSGALGDAVNVLVELDIEYDLFDEVEENPSAETLEKARQTVGDKQIDFVIGIGGGSPLDAAKMIGVLLYNRKKHYRDIFKDGSLKSLPVIAIPTTSGTGSEVTPYAVITDREQQIKTSCQAKVFPVLALINPKYFKAMPKSVTVSTAVDAMCHLVEGYIARKRTLYSDRLAEVGMSYFRQAKEDLMTGNFTDSMHEALIHASTYGGMVISQSGTCIPHGMGYPLTYNYGVSHGKATSLFLPGVLEMFKERDHVEPEKIRTILSMLDFNSFEAFQAFIHEAVGDVSMTKEEAKAYSEWMGSNQRKLDSLRFEVTIDDLYKLYERACRLT